MRARRGDPMTTLRRAHGNSHHGTQIEARIF
jgi:hypothetical protein